MSLHSARPSLKRHHRPTHRTLVMSQLVPCHSVNSVRTIYVQSVRTNYLPTISQSPSAGMILSHIFCWSMSTRVKLEGRAQGWTFSPNQVYGVFVNTEKCTKSHIFFRKTSDSSLWRGTSPPQTQHSTILVTIYGVSWCFHNGYSFIYSISFRHMADKKQTKDTKTNTHIDTKTNNLMYWYYENC